MTVTDTAQSQAKAQMNSINAMVERLEHARECTPGTFDNLCTLSFDTLEALGVTSQDYHDADAAAEAIQEDPLSVLVRDGWYSPGDIRQGIAGRSTIHPCEYEILLCTGGPACRIRGTLGNHGEPETATLEYQDWGTPWTPYFHVDITNALITYAQQFYFGD